jgi:hypothetical protein
MLERWTQIKSNKGDIPATEAGRSLVVQFGDEPLPATEARTEIKRFTPEAREILRKKRYSIYELTGKSIKTLREQSRGKLTIWHEGHEFENLPSALSEVAINPRKQFLPDSNLKTFEQQEEMIRKFSQELKEEIPEVEAIIGEVPDYAELDFKHLNATRERLFRRRYRFGRYYCYTRTKTPVNNTNMLFIGRIEDNDSLYIYDSPSDARRELWITPLIKPV